MTCILIAEDEQRIVSFLEKRLRADGYTTVSVGTGVDAAALARDDSFDLMILDLGLPGIDGHEVLRQVRGRGERLPIIVLSARTALDDTVGVLDGGANDHVAKPFRFEELLSSVWGCDLDPNSNVVAVYVKYLCNKLGNDAIETVRDAGDRLRG